MHYIGSVSHLISSLSCTSSWWLKNLVKTFVTKFQVDNKTSSRSVHAEAILRWEFIERSLPVQDWQQFNIGTTCILEQSDLSSSATRILSSSATSSPRTACSRTLVSPTKGRTWPWGGITENRTSPLLHPAASGKVSIKAQVMGAFLQLVASFLPLENR